MRVRNLPSGSQVVGTRAPSRQVAGRVSGALRASLFVMPDVGPGRVVRETSQREAARIEAAFAAVAPPDAGRDRDRESAQLGLVVGGEIGFDTIGRDSKRRLGRIPRAVAVALLVGAGFATGCAYEPTGEVAPVECSPSLYQIDAVALPRSGTGAADLALDLDGDGTADNRLGRLHATLAGFFSDWRPDEHLTARLTRPGAAALPWFATVERCRGTLAVDLARGLDDDGDGRFTIAPGDDAAIGRDDATGRGRTAADGTGEVPLLGFTDGLGRSDDAGWIDARGLAVALAPSLDEDGGLTATVGVGLDLTDVALAPVAGFLTSHLHNSALARGLDGDDDGVVSVAELRASEAVAALIARDVDVAGADGVLDHVSIAFSIHASPY